MTGCAPDDYGLGEERTERPSFLPLRGLAGPAAEALEQLSPAAWRLGAAAFDALRAGEGPTTSELSIRVALASSEAQPLLAVLAEVGLLELEGDHLTGALGLTRTLTPHALVLGGVALHTWCAIDALGIPAALGSDATARSTCGLCGAPIEMVFVGGEPRGEPGVVTWAPQKSCANVRREFCPKANAFCSQAHLDAWRAQAGSPEGEVLTLEAVLAQGRKVWGDLRRPEDGSPVPEEKPPS